MSKTVHLTPKDDLKAIIKENKNVIIDFTATWCPPCQKLGPILEEKAKSGNFLLVKIDVDQNPELSEEYEVSGIPLVISFTDGKQVDKFTGCDEGKLDSMIGKF